MLREAILCVLQDPGFEVPSPAAASARETASAITTYCGEPHLAPEPFKVFASKLVNSLKTCFVSGRTLRLQKEAMWGAYHMLRTSTSFHSDWVHFVRAAVERTPSPIFYQHVTHEMFKMLVKLEYPCVESGSDAAVKSISREKENVLRYVAGYVCRKLQNKIKKSSLPNKDDLVLCLLVMMMTEKRMELKTG